MSRCTRTTGDAHVGDGPNATKKWVNARISIAPNATNEVGQPHTFTVTLQKDTGAGFVPGGAGEHVRLHADELERCDAVLNAGGGTCTTPVRTRTRPVSARSTFTSTTAGKVTGHATATLIGGRSSPFTVVDERRRAELGRRGEDVRGREHPDHAGDGDEPGRHEPHAALPHQRQRRAWRRLRERAGGDGLHGEHHRRARHAGDAELQRRSVRRAPATW